MCAAREFTVFVLYAAWACVRMYDATLQMLFACVCVHMHVAIVQYAHDAVYVCMCVYSMLDECSMNALCRANDWCDSDAYMINTVYVCVCMLRLFRMYIIWYIRICMYVRSASIHYVSIICCMRMCTHVRCDITDAVCVCMCVHACCDSAVSALCVYVCMCVYSMLDECSMNA